MQETWQILELRKRGKPTCTPPERKLATATYAPGPWKARSNGRWEVVTAHGHLLVPRVVGSSDDACLIAAAPEMYELLEETYNLMTRGDLDGFIRAITTKAPDVLAKARNEATKWSSETQ
jgi:hypothetical protein